MKTGANMQLLVQATDRQRLADSVYVAVPKPRNTRSGHWRGIKRVLRRLELGLITVAIDSPMQTVTVEFDPLPYQQRASKGRRRALLQEVADRSGDYNTGGSTRQKLMTAYRENAILVATCLAHVGRPMKPAELRDMGTGQKTLSILAGNHYGWFQRVDRGVYQVTAKGQAEIETYPEVVLHCRKKLGITGEGDSQ